MPFKTTPELPPPERQPLIAPRDLSVVMRHRRLQLFFVDGNVYEYLKPFQLGRRDREKKNRGTAISVGGIYLATFLKSPFEQEWGAWWCSLWQNVTLTERHIGHAHSRTGICGDTWLLSFLCPSFSSVNTSSFFFFFFPNKGDDPGGRESRL